ENVDGPGAPTTRPPLVAEVRLPTASAAPNRVPAPYTAPLQLSGASVVHVVAPVPAGWTKVRPLRVVHFAAFGAPTTNAIVAPSTLPTATDVPKPLVPVLGDGSV